MINYLTIQQPKITRFLTYKFKYKKNEPYSFYRLFDSTTGRVLGTMKAGPQYINDSARQFSPNADSYKSFYIYRLRVAPDARGQGVGTALLNVAKKESIRELCSGNVHLVSKNPITPGETPHLFYRKNGFSCGKYYAGLQKYFDECIKKKEPVDIKCCGTKIPMYIEKCVVNQDKDIDKWYKLKIKCPQWFNTL